MVFEGKDCVKGLIFISLWGGYLWWIYSPFQFAQHGYILMGASPSHALIVGSV